MTRSIFNRSTGYWRRTTYWDRHDIKEARIRQSYEGKRVYRKPRKKYTLKPVAGKWRMLLLKKCRETGYVHTEGPHAGSINYYRMTQETGISRDALYKILKTGSISMTTLGRLCDVFHCQPNDFIQRVTTDQDVTPSYDLPASLQEDDLPGDEYVRPSEL